MKPWILLSAALLGVSLTPAETALAKGYDAYSLLDSARGHGERSLFQNVTAR